MTSPEDFMQRLGQIAGDDLSDGEFSLEVRFQSLVDAKAFLSELRLRKKAIAMLKREVSATIAEVQSHFATQTAEVGTDLTSIVGGLVLGRKLIGKANTLSRDALRRRRVEVVAPYEEVKNWADRIVIQLDVVRDRIQMLLQQQSLGEVIDAESDLEPAALPGAKLFVFVDELVKGPYSHEQLQALFDIGSISLETLCCVEGSEEWTAYGTLS